MKLNYPAATRNTEPIAEVLGQFLGDAKFVVEIGSGSGQHATHFATVFPHICWQPTDPDSQARASIEAYRQEAAHENLCKPLDLDVHVLPWPVSRADAVVSINVIHVSPWHACTALLEGAARILPRGGLLYLYGPFRVDGHFTTESNRQFDASLRARNPAWGVRDLAEIEREAESDFFLATTVDMPANNLSVILRRR